MMLWTLTGAAVFAAIVALLRARRTARRLERLSESYWELRYEHGKLNARVTRLEGVDLSKPSEQPAGAHDRSGTVAFVPLSSLKR